MVMAPTGTTAVRAYIRTLRIARGYTQPELAALIGLSARGYIDYESGETKELKQSTLIRALEALCAPYEDVRDLIVNDRDAEQGRSRALDRCAPEVREQIQELEKTIEGRQALIEAAGRFRRNRRRAANRNEHSV